MQDYFSSPTSSVKSDRILYTPSLFARSALLNLQEVGSLKARSPHTSTRSGLTSYLYFLVLDGEGSLTYEGRQYQLKQGDCVFIDCQKPYSHSTSENLWSLAWCHFYGTSMTAIYEKYKERGGSPVFHPENISSFIHIINDLYDVASSMDYIRDMRINEILSKLLTLIMEESWAPENTKVKSRKKLELDSIKLYLDEHYTEHISLDELASKFYMNKFYMTKIFKETYGTTINNYLISKRITKAKQLLRFTDMTIDEIGNAIGMDGANYFCRMFKKIEGISPNTYKKQW